MQNGRPARRRGRRPRGPDDPLLVSVVIVTYESAEFIGACLGSVKEHAGLSFEAIVVDNASSDASLDLARRQYPEATLIRLERNRGFAVAANVGAAQARAPYLLFLNPDAELRPGALPALVRHLEDHLTVAAAGPRLVHPDGSPQDAAFTYPTLLMTWLEFVPHPGRVLHGALNGRLSSPDGEPIAIDHPLGACILVRRSAWDDVGPFDERFFLYCEEVDWCMRAKGRGWSVAHVPAAVAVHHGSASAAAAPQASRTRLYTSRLRLHRKHRGFVFRWLAEYIMRVGLARERRRLQASRDQSAPAQRAGVERVLNLLSGKFKVHRSRLPRPVIMRAKPEGSVTPLSAETDPSLCSG